jgi:hypothetical protein
VPEVRRLLLALVEPPERFSFHLAWSAFRRHHQAVAKACHAARRGRLVPGQSSYPQVQVLQAMSHALTDQQWTRISPLLPPQTPAVGRPPLDHRRILAGMLWIAGTGANWRDLPVEFGPWQTVYSRYRHWRRQGIWQRVLDALQIEESA